MNSSACFRLLALGLHLTIVTDLTLAGPGLFGTETAPLENAVTDAPAVTEALTPSTEILFEPMPPASPRPASSKARIGRLLEAAAAKYRIPTDLLKAVAYQESRWNPRAKSFDGGHGKGVMQIDDRFHAFARTNSVWNAARNINYGARYLRSHYKGSWNKALRRYNGGAKYPGVIRRWMKRRPWKKWEAKSSPQA